MPPSDRVSWGGREGEREREIIQEREGWKEKRQEERKRERVCVCVSTRRYRSNGQRGKCLQRPIIIDLYSQRSDSGKGPERWTSMKGARILVDRWV